MASQGQLHKSSYSAETGVWKFQEMRWKSWVTHVQSHLCVSCVTHRKCGVLFYPRNTVSLASVLCPYRLSRPAGCGSFPSVSRCQPFSGLSLEPLNNFLLFIVCAWLFCLPLSLCSTCLQCPQEPEEGVSLLELEVQTVVSCQVGVGNPTWILFKSSKCS